MLPAQQLKSTTQFPIRITTNMVTIEISSILAYCSPTAHGALAVFWNRFSYRIMRNLQLNPRSDRRMVSTISTYNSPHVFHLRLFLSLPLHTPSSRHRRVLFRLGGTVRKIFFHPFHLCFLASAAWLLGPYHDDTKSRNNSTRSHYTTH
jgi:hypothetical protein